MAAIQNDRDVLLQAAAVRVVPVPIPIDQVAGLEYELDNLGDGITSALNNTKNIVIYASSTSFIGTATTSPTSITLTAEKRNGLTGTVSWSVLYGSATLTPSGDTCSVAGASVTGSSVTIRARVTAGATNHDAYVTLTRLGTLAGQAAVSLATQVTGQLASGNITGLGALAILNTVDLNTQTTGALNGQTQVTNLGTLAYANAIAANQIGAGTLAAGVIYAGAINADNITSGTITGRTLRTAISGSRVEIDGSNNALKVYNGANLLLNVDPTAGYIRVKATGTVSAIEVRDGSGPGIDVVSAGNASTFTTSNASGYGVTAFHNATGSGAAVSGYANFSGNGVVGSSATGFGGIFENRSGTSSAMRIIPQGALPTNKPDGAICFSGGWLCFAAGGVWYKSNGTPA